MRARIIPEDESSWVEPLPFALRGARWVLVLAALVVILVPLWMVVATSFASNADVARTGGVVIWPRQWSLGAYRQMLANRPVLISLVVSIGVTAVGTVLSTAITAMAAYGLSRPGSMFHRAILFVFIGTYLFSPGLIPNYLVVQGLGLIDTFAALVVPGLVWAFNMVVLRTFFMGLPMELFDAARIDGAGEFTILTRVVLPLSKAPLAVVALFYGVGYWNNFFNALLYLTDSGKWPLQLVLRQYVLQGQRLPGQDFIPGHVQPPDIALQMAIVVLAMVPILLVYPFVQRHFTKGVIIGAIKG